MISCVRDYNLYLLYHTTLFAFPGQDWERAFTERSGVIESKRSFDIGDERGERGEGELHDDMR
jgi:hypothetical protein